MKLSVIIPAYNVAEYIGECIDSVLGQTYRDLEVIVVNDGSTDNTRTVIAGYEHDSRLVVIDKPNGGLSDARNVGIARATGGLITFLDGDDKVSDDCYESNISYFEGEYSPDMVQFPMLIDWQSERQHLHMPKFCILQQEEVFPAWWQNRKLIYSAGNKIYRKEIFHSISYPKGRCFEDMYIVPELARVIRIVIVSECGVYFYRYRPGSILNSTLIYEKHRDQLDAMLRIYKESLRFPVLKKERAEFWINIIWWQFYSLHAYSKCEREASISEFEKYNLSTDDFITGRLSGKNKLRILFLKIFGFRLIFWGFQLWKLLRKGLAR